MLKNEKLNLENFKVEEYLKVFPETATQYLDWKVQQLWFYKVYPEGAIITDEPQPDAFKTPDTWVATTRVYLTRQDRIDNLPAIQRSAKRGPKDNAETEDTLDTYTLSIIASIAGALTALGFGPALLNNAEKEKLSADLLGIPQDLDEQPTQAPAPVVENPTPVVESKPVVNESAPVTAPRRGRPPKAKTDEQPTQAPAPVVENPTPVVESTPVVNTTSSVEEPTPVAKPKVEAPIVETSSSEFSSLEEARAVLCTYRNLKDISMGEIWDNRASDKRYGGFVDWCETGNMAPIKCPKELAALKYIKENS
jgi:hypothetical protein